MTTATRRHLLAFNNSTGQSTAAPSAETHTRTSIKQAPRKGMRKESLSPNEWDHKLFNRHHVRSPVTQKVSHDNATMRRREGREAVDRRRERTKCLLYLAPVSEHRLGGERLSTVPIYSLDLITPASTFRFLEV